MKRLQRNVERDDSEEDENSTSLNSMFNQIQNNASKYPNSAKKPRNVEPNALIEREISQNMV